MTLGPPLASIEPFPLFRYATCLWRWRSSAREDAVLHLWGATDDDRRSREDLDRHPICSGAESFLAGTANCRVVVSDVDALFAELRSAGVLHDVSRGGVDATDFGTREFATLDADGNLLTFFRWNDG